MLEGGVGSVDAAFVEGFDVDGETTDLAGGTDNGADAIAGGDWRGDGGGRIGVGWRGFHRRSGSCGLTFVT